MLLAGLWFVASKSKMNYFLQPFVDECIQAEEEGLTVISKKFECSCFQSCISRSLHSPKYKAV